MTRSSGVFTISLDFELYWGVRDKRTLQEYQNNLEGVREAVDGLLDLFRCFDVHATWAIVGLVMCNDAHDALRRIPKVLPNYRDPILSPYPYLERIVDSAGQGVVDELDAMHFAPELVHRVAFTANQEVATHTFSHYYCLEDGSNEEALEADLAAAAGVSRNYELEVHTIVFPRNQYSDDVLKVCCRRGLTAYRGNQSFFAYAALSDRTANSGFRRIIRLADAYVSLSGANTYELENLNKEGALVNVPASFFLRPVSRRLRLLEPLRRRRLTSAMTNAAREGRLFHLWWHPHNFGVNKGDNLAFLECLLRHFSELRQRYGMESLNMGEVAARIAADVA